MDVLILDLTHGGDILAEEYLAMHHSVSCVDVYRTASEQRKKDLAEMGVKISDSAEGRYDLAVMPAHCPHTFLEGATYDKRITFNQAVKGFINDTRFRIEVTGVKGKTSSCYILAHILSCSGMKVFLHTSRGQGPWVDGEHIIQKNMSISPTSMLRLPEGNYDCIVAEVSLGGSGRADIAVITNLAEDYSIAKNTKKASEAKAEILTKGTNIVHEDDLGVWQRYGKYNFQTYGSNVRVISKPWLGMPLEIMFEYDGLRLATLDPGYLSLQYIQAMDLAAMTCRSMGVPADAVVKGISTFRGVQGRGEISFRSGTWYVNDRNPGISAASIRMTLGCLKEMSALDEAFVIVDPVSRKVCDKMDTEEILKIASEFGVRAHFTDAAGSIPKIPDGTKVLITFVKEGFQ